jgi:repressor LexA
MESLLPNEQRLFDCLKQYIRTYHFPPSIRDLKQAMGEKSQSKIQSLLKELRYKGYINWEDGKSRSFQILQQTVPQIFQPTLRVLGAIQAGVVVEHPSDMQDQIDLGSRYKPSDYALRVYGDSMINAHICDGDFVVVRPEPDLWLFKKQDIAAVWVEGEGSTLKYLEFEAGWVVLKPANERYQSRRVEIDKVQLQGVVVGVHRDLIPLSKHG